MEIGSIDSEILAEKYRRLTGASPIGRGNIVDLILEALRDNGDVLIVKVKPDAKHRATGAQRYRLLEIVMLRSEYIVACVSNGFLRKSAMEDISRGRQKGNVETFG